MLSTIFRRLRAVSAKSRLDRPLALHNIESPESAILGEAAATGNLGAIKAIRARGVNLHVENEIYLKIAVENGQSDVVRYLHEDGAVLASCEGTSLFVAINRGHWEVLHYLFNQGCRVGADVLSSRQTDAEPAEGIDPVVLLARENLRVTSGGRSGQALPDTGPRWGTYSMWGRAVLPHLKSPREVTQFAQHPLGHGGFESRQTGEELVVYADRLQQHLESRFPFFADRFSSFTESDLSDRKSTTVIGNCPVSGPTFANMTFFLECVSRVPKLDAVCEIGGGYGGPARLWLKNDIHRPSTYVIIDLPESLFFSEVFLRTELGIDRVHYVSSTNVISPAVASSFSVLLCPVDFISALAAIDFDLVYNTLSMQEMSEKYVEFYMKWLDVQPCSFFYSFNYAAQPFDQHPESANNGVPQLSSRWHPSWIAEYAAGPSPALHILAEKHDEPSDETIMRGERLLADFIDRDADVVTFVNLMFAARMCQSVHIAYRVLCKVADEMSNLPREVTILLDMIGKYGRRELSADQIKRVETIAAAVVGQHAAADVSAHLSVLRASYSSG